MEISYFRLYEPDYILQRYLLRFCITPSLVFDHVFLQAAFAYHDTVRNADQFQIGKHHAGTLVAIIH